MSPNPALGASGAIFGVVGAYFVFVTRNEWILGSSGQAASSAMGQTILMNIVLGAMNPVIDNWGHLGGALGGAAMAYYFGPRLYLCDMPNGARVIVDKPICRLPRSIESIPGRVTQQVKSATSFMRLPSLPLFGFDKSMPWNKGRMDEYEERQRQAFRQAAPNRSIKPRPIY
jgi:Rhomboid family